jgi:hypothetical protein
LHNGTILAVINPPARHTFAPQHTCARFYS